jgi:Mrp family chromosome partitioning ATPase
VPLGGPAKSDVHVLAAGPLPPNPHDLLESRRFEELLHAAEERYDLVVIDTPPASIVSDATPLTTRVSGVLVVARLGRTTRDSLTRLRDQLRNLRAPLIGVVANGVAGGQSGYGYGYAPQVQDPPRRARRRTLRGKNAEAADEPGKESGPRNGAVADEELERTVTER